MVRRSMPLSHMPWQPWRGKITHSRAPSSQTARPHSGSWKHRSSHAASRAAWPGARTAASPRSAASCASFSHSSGVPRQGSPPSSARRRPTRSRRRMRLILPRKSVELRMARSPCPLEARTVGSAGTTNPLGHEEAQLASGTRVHVPASLSHAQSTHRSRSSSGVRTPPAQAAAQSSSSRMRTFCTAGRSRPVRHVALWRTR
mmetsp:Transcript_29705/g.79791  ORF Transcript_29705/g.79791 Transcript_29705/m.79791 type:complete len:202 (-) Transcript_29705:843-1448(-)